MRGLGNNGFRWRVSILERGNQTNSSCSTQPFSIYTTTVWQSTLFNFVTEMPPTELFHVVIVGGGIAGLAAAIALRSPNRRITILEQSRLSTEIGATISLQPNATRIIKETWGLRTLLEGARGTVDRGFRVYNIEGKRANEIQLQSRTEYGGDRIVWHRQDLHTYLKDAATNKERVGRPAELRTSSRVISCNCTTGSITLESGEVLEADLIIGADGIHSKLRSFVLEKDVKAKPTGLSAYRLMMPSNVLEEHAPSFAAKIKLQDPYTSMVMAHDCRLVMGPARDGEVYSVVGLVPDDKMNENPDSAQSWVTEGDTDKMLKTFKDFPGWAKEMLQQAESVGLWQLRDIDPLDTWVRGRVILVGDAAHAMLPTQGQGASQAIEDAEALGAFFGDLKQDFTEKSINRTLCRIFKARFDRASLIQKYSREAAKPATEKGSSEIKM